MRAIAPSDRLIGFVRITAASPEDAAAIAAVRVDAADRLTRDFGDGHWSAHTNEAAVLRDIAASRVLVVRDSSGIVGTLTLQKKKPWAIDLAYFTPCARVLYLINMAVAPDRQRTGVGRALLNEALAAARAHPADVIRLDAYDCDAGASGFYRKCGYTEVGGKSYRGVPLLYFELKTGVRP
jgi:ribosomal protein S18 acetylase RimI-like enzyme